MFSFKATFFATLLTGAAASNPKLVSYEPQTNVADHTAGISLDQAAIDSLVGFDNEGSFADAERVYREGGNSKSYAEIYLASGLPTAVKKGTEISGKTTDGTSVTGKAIQDYPQNSLIIGFQYPTGDQYENHVACKVGGLPASLQVLDGCLDDTGANQEIIVSGGVGTLAYDTLVNKNGRTIAGFSTSADTRMRPGDDLGEPYFDFFEPYLQYYGTFDFGDEIASAGFNGDDTNLDKGNVKLTGYDFRARGEVAKKASAYINTGLYVIREIYDALHDCSEECGVDQCNDDAVHALDEAVGFYVGSEYVTDPDGQGNLFYGLAEKRALNFATGVNGIAGQSMVNNKIMQEFNAMKSKLNAGQCDESESNAREIIRLMQIPLIQGTIRYAQILSTTIDPLEKSMAEGAVFAAGILPKVNACNEDTATTIYEHMRLTPSKASKADFDAVKRAFESVYDCLEVSCADIGGMIDPATGDTYIDGAEPCGRVTAMGVSNDSGAGTFSLSIGVAAIAGLAALFM
uniref:Uncharacterized protein n=1 Tax=Entomoneis paludosa TaxID=265537 RepID=A0A7S2YN77_9STRA